MKQDLNCQDTGTKPRDPVSPSQSIPWTYIGGSSGEEAEELSCRDVTYLFYPLPGGRNKRKGAQGGCPQWPLAPVPPLPAAIASLLPRLHGPVSGPTEEGRNATLPRGAVGKEPPGLKCTP